MPCQTHAFYINGRNRNGYRQLGEIGRKSVDLLICRRDDTSIVAAVELNGPHHNDERQQASDRKKRNALEEAGIPLLVFYPHDLPDASTIRKAMALHIVERRRYEAERDQRLQR